jgi:adenosine kinase
VTEQKQFDVIVSASIAFDHVMAFGGSFKDHMIADKMDVLSVSFLVDSLKQQRGGVGGNMAYSLALLGAETALVGAVGKDFDSYGAVLQDLGVDLTHIVQIPDDFTSNAYMNADRQGNQIVAFYPGAGAHSVEIDVSDIARRSHFGLISAAGPDAMMEHARQFIAAGTKLVFDPAQQIVILTGEQLTEGINGAEIVVGNEYEYGMIQNKTGMTFEDIARKVPIAIRTLAERGSEIRSGGDVVTIPPARPEPFVDPTGGGDAWRSGFLKGLLIGADLPVAGRMGSLAATYAIEFHGTQEHDYHAAGFVARFDEAFPDFAGTIPVEVLERSHPAHSASSN